MSKRRPRCVLFGAGYLGARVMGRLLDEGYDVRAYSRTGRVDRSSSGHAVSALQRCAALDLTGDEDSVCARLDDIFADADAVITCYAPSRGLDADRAASGAKRRALYVSGTKRIAMVACARDVPVLVHCSSISACPAIDGIVTEETVGPCSPRGDLQREAELAASVHTSAWILRLGGLYGPGRVPPPRDPTSRDGDGNEWLNLVHVDDAALAVARAASRAPCATGRIVHVVDERARTQAQFHSDRNSWAPDVDEIPAEPRGKRVISTRISELGVHCSLVPLVAR